MRIYIFLALICVCGRLTLGHIRLTWPPPRQYGLDFLDNIRTDPPCGVPKGLGPTTNFEAGSSIDVTWHLGYPHQGGFQIEILDDAENVSLKLTDGKLIGQNDTTTLHHVVQLPPDYICHNCTLRVLRQALEWGRGYLFWTCADVNILPAAVADPDACRGHLQFDTPESGRDYSVDWEYDDAAQNIRFTMTGTLLGQDYWMAVGLSNSPAMASTDVIVGWVRADGSSALEDRWASGTSTPSVDPDQDVTLISAGVSAGVSTIVFTRSLTTGHPDTDFQISDSNCPYILYAIGPHTNGAPGYHGTAKRATSNRICFKACQAGPTYSNDCSGRGTVVAATGICDCDRLYFGSRCQHKDTCIVRGDCSNHGACINMDATSYPKHICFCDPGYHGMLCEKVSPISSSSIDYNAYTDIVLSPTAVLYFRVLQATDELEVVMRAKTHNWLAVGFKPESLRQTCQDFPIKLSGSGTGEPEGESEPEGSTAEPEGTTAEPEGTTAEPEGSTAEPEGTTAEPEGSTAEPEGTSAEPEGSTAEPEGTTAVPEDETTGGGTTLLHPMDCADIVIGVVRGDRSCIGDFYTRDRSTPRRDEFYGGSQSLTAAFGFEDGEYTVMAFRRPLNASEPTDHSIGDWTTTIIWAMGQEIGNYRHVPDSGLSVGSPSIPDFYRQDEVKYHGHGNTQRGSTDFNLLSVPLVACQVQFWEESKLYKVEWTYIASSNEIEFTMTGRLNGESWWMAVGLSADRAMIDTDVALGWVDATGQVALTDRWNVGRFAPVLDPSQDLDLIRGDLVDGVTTIVYRKSLTTSDVTQDFQITDTNCPYVIYGIGPINPSGDIRKHRFRPRVTQQKICFTECLAPVAEPSSEPTSEPSSEPESEPTTVDIFSPPSSCGHMTAHLPVAFSLLACSVAAAINL